MRAGHDPLPKEACALCGRVAFSAHSDKGLFCRAFASKFCMPCTEEYIANTPVHTDSFSIQLKYI